MNSFNVLREPCINAIYKSGESKLITLRDVFRDSKQILKFQYNGYPKAFEFALYRLIVLLALRIYRITWDDLEDILKNGFDMDIFDRYTEKLERDGVSFDLFGDVPFLLTPRADFTKREYNKTAPLSVLNPFMKTGHNEIFYNIKRKNTIRPVEEGYEFNDEELFAAVVFNALYSMYSGMGSTPCATGSLGGIPVCVLYQGDNLHETIILNMPYMTKREHEDTLPYWERHSRVIDLTKLPESFINYACVPTMKVTLKEAKGAIRVVKCGSLYDKGSKPQDLLKDYLLQRDPNLVTKEFWETATDENGKRVKTAKDIPLTSHALKKGTFLQLARIDSARIISNDRKKLIYDKLDILGLTDKKLTITFYAQAIKSPSGDHVDVCETFSGIDAIFLSDRSQERARLVTAHIDATNDRLAYMYSQYVNDIRTESAGSENAQSTENICAGYLDEIKELFTTKYIPMIEGDGDIQDVLLDISKTCRETFDALPTLQNNYITKGRWSNMLYYSLKKLTE